MYLPVLISHSHNSHRLSKGMIQIPKTFECFARIMIQEGNLRVHFNIKHKYTLRNCHIMFTHTYTHKKKSNSNSSKLFENKFLSRACILVKNAFLYYLSIYAAIGLLNKPVSPNSATVTEVHPVCQNKLSTTFTIVQPYSHHNFLKQTSLITLALWVSKCFVFYAVSKPFTNSQTDI